MNNKCFLGFIEVLTLCALLSGCNNTQHRNENSGNMPTRAALEKLATNNEHNVQQKDVDKLHAIITRNNNTIDKLKAFSRWKSNVNSSKTEQITDLEKTNKSLAKSLDTKELEKQATIAELNTSRISHQRTLDHQDVRINTQQRYINGLENHIKESKISNSKEVQKLTEELNSEKELLSQSNIALDAARLTIDQHITVIDTLSKYASNLKDINSDLTTLTEALEISNAELRTDLQNLESELSRIVQIESVSKNNGTEKEIETKDVDLKERAETALRLLDVYSEKITQLEEELRVMHWLFNSKDTDLENRFEKQSNTEEFLKIILEDLHGISKQADSMKLKIQHIENKETD